MSDNFRVHNDSTYDLTRKILSVLSRGLLGVTEAAPETPSGLVLSSQTRVGGFSISKAVVPVAPNAAYLAGDVIGANPFELTGVLRAGIGTAVLQSITVVDSSNVGPNFDILFATQATAFATVADNAAFSWGALAGAGVQGRVTFATADYATAGSKKVITKPNLGIVLDGLTNGASSSIFLALVTQTGWTSTVSNGLQIQLGFLLD